MVSRKRTFFYKILRDIETWQMHSATPQIVAVPGIDRVVIVVEEGKAGLKGFMVMDPSNSLDWKGEFRE